MSAKKILIINSSGRSQGSVSREIVTTLVNKLSESPSVVVTRDLSANPLPFVDSDWVNARFNPQAPDEAKNAVTTTTSNTCVQEVLDADIIVIGSPMYNLNLSAALKSWIDFVVVAGQTFKYNEDGHPQGLVSGKKVYLCVSTGGIELGSPYDHLTPYLKNILGFIGITDITILGAPKGDKTEALALISAL